MCTRRSCTAQIVVVHSSEKKYLRRKIAKALFVNGGKHISLTIFDDELVTLHSIYKPNAKVEDSSNFIEENATELLLSVEATVFYNKNFNITSIQQNH